MLLARPFVMTSIAAFSLVATVAVPAQAQFRSLTSLIPARANAIVVLNVDKIHHSPLAKKQNWRQEQEKAYAAGLMILPPQADQFVMAAEMDFEFMQPIWEVAALTVSYEPSMPQLAARWNGRIDRLENRNAVVLPSDTYVVQFGEHMLGAMRPGNRQHVARWIRQVNTIRVGGNLSPYLKEAVGFAEKVGTPIIMALDLRNVVSPESVRERIEAFEALKGQKVDMDRWAKGLASIQGITLGITIRDRVFGKIKVDFDQDVSFVKDLAKPILLEALAKNAAMIDEFEDWRAKVQGKQITLEGHLYRSGMQRILSVLDAPPSLKHGSAPSTPTPHVGQQAPDEESLKLLASQQYYKSVDGYVNDLRRSKKQTMGNAGQWFGRYARLIDQLPLLNVDPDLVDYGSFVSSSLRQGEEALRGYGGRARTAQLNVQPSYNVRGRWGSYGSYAMAGSATGGYSVAVTEDLKAGQRERVRVRTEERVATLASAREIMQEVVNASSEIRRNMTQKYKAEF